MTSTIQQLPLGRSGFSALRDSNAIYVDKTKMVCKLAENDGKLFFARPRRFGKLVSPMGLFTVFDLGILTAGLAFTLVLNGLEQTDSTVASTFLLGEPFGAVGWGVLLLGEQIGFVGYCGMTMVFLSILLLCWEQHHRSKKKDY